MAKRKVVGPLETEFYKSILSIMPIICVDLVIQTEGQVLLIKRNNSPAKDHWWFPGGRIMKGEKIKETAERKALEEVGLLCSYNKILGVEDTYFACEDEMESDIHTINIICEMLCNKFIEIKLDNNHSKFIWLNINNLENYKLHKGVLRPLRKLIRNE